MSNSLGLTDPHVLLGLSLAADVLIALASLIVSALIFDYGRTKAEGLASRGCNMTALLFAGVAVLRIADVFFISSGNQAFDVYLNFGVGLIGTVVALLMIKTHPHSPSMRIASRLDARNRELEAQNAQLLSERNRAQEAFDHSMAFLANISYELRVPLSAMLGMQELLRLSKLDDEQQRIAKVMEQSANSLLGLVNDIRDLANIKAGRAELQTIPFKVESVIQESIRGCAEGARLKKLFVNTDVDPAISFELLGDARRLKKILEHIIVNAIKFTDRGGIVIRASLDPSPNPNVVAVRFSVRDTGIGLTEEEQAFLFEPFVNVNGTIVRRYGDFGLGLYTSQLLVDVMGGTMGVESQKGQGSTFWFTLNLSPVQRPQSAAESAQSALSIKRTEPLAN